MYWEWVLTPPELNVFKRKNSSSALSKLYLAVLLLSFTSGLAQDTVVITSDPTGVTIEVDGLISPLHLLPGRLEKTRSTHKVIGLPSPSSSRNRWFWSFPRKALFPGR